MRVYLDDKRAAPEGWRLVTTAKEALDLLETGEVMEISLDHDLGDLQNVPEQTGYTVLNWIEAETALNPQFVPPVIHIHTANPVARKRMEMAVQAIVRLDNSR